MVAFFLSWSASNSMNVRGTYTLYNNRGEIFLVSSITKRVRCSEATTNSITRSDTFMPQTICFQSIHSHLNVFCCVLAGAKSATERNRLHNKTAICGLGIMSLSLKPHTASKPILFIHTKRIFHVFMLHVCCAFVCCKVLFILYFFFVKKIFICVIYIIINV